MASSQNYRMLADAFGSARRKRFANALYCVTCGSADGLG